MNTIARILVGAAATLGACAVGAQNIDEEDLALVYGDQATVSIATGTQQSLRRAPAVATVITAADIAAMGAVDLDEVMEAVPGMHVARDNITNAAVYAMRGIFTTGNAQILLLQNGVPMTLMFLGNKGNVWGGLPVDNIARIEIIRGPGSALYGADAFSGVVNIITKTAADAPGTQIGSRIGSFRTADAWIHHGGKIGEIDVAAYLRIGTTEGAKETVMADAQTLRNPIFSRAPGPLNTGRDMVDASLDLGYGKWRLRAGYKLRDNVELGSGVASSLDPLSRAKSERITADLSWFDPQFGEHLSVGANASFLHYEDLIPTNLALAPVGATVGGALFPEGQIGGPNKWERQFRFSAHATYTGLADHSLRIGVGHDDLHLYRTLTVKNFFTNQTTGALTRTALQDYSFIQPFMVPQRRLGDYVYVQDEWRMARDLTLTLGVRRDVYSDVGSTNNPRLALVWDVSHDLTAKLLTGRAFRAPSFNELYAINNPVNKGNPALKPETINTVETAVSWQASRNLLLKGNLFRYLIRNSIVAVPNVGAAGSTYQNSGDQRGRGYELEAVWDVSRQFRLTANYSHQKASVEKNGTDAGYVPQYHLYTRGDWRFASGWILGGQVNRVTDRKRASGDTRASIPDYTTVDLVLRTERGKSDWNYSAAVRNLFNQKVYEPSLSPGTALPGDLPQARRSFYLQATYSM